MGHDNPPYHFDTDRVFAALYSKALEAIDSTPMPWTELPIHVAVEHLRNLLADEDYDHLYQLNDPAQFPLYEQRSTRIPALHAQPGRAVLPVCLCEG